MPIDEQAGPSALEATSAELRQLVATGPAPDRIVAAIGDAVAAWAAEPEMTQDAVLTRVEQLWDGFSTEAAALQEQLSDATEGDAAGLAQAQRVLAALDAAVATLAAVSARIGGRG